MVCLLEYGFIIKGYNSGIPGGRGGIEPGVGEEVVGFGPVGLSFTCAI